MTLQDRLGPMARTLFAATGALLLVATVATVYSDWPVIEAHHQSSLGLFAVCAVALPIAFLIIIWASIGRLKEWRIEGDHLSIRLMSLTSWMRIITIRREDIRGFAVESYAYEDGNDRTAHWIVMTLTDGKRYKSPMTYDGEEIQEARLALDSMREGSRIIGVDEI